VYVYVCLSAFLRVEKEQECASCALCDVDQCDNCLF
jgi:hypothetical protein